MSGEIFGALCPWNGTWAICLPWILFYWGQTQDFLHSSIYLSYIPRSFLSKARLHVGQAGLRVALLRSSWSSACHLQLLGPTGACHHTGHLSYFSIAMKSPRQLVKVWDSQFHDPWSCQGTWRQAAGAVVEILVPIHRHKAESSLRMLWGFDTSEPACLQESPCLQQTHTS